VYRSPVVGDHSPALEGAGERFWTRRLQWPADLPSLGQALGPIAVAAAYFLGAQLGFVLRFPPATTSILWPPNAIVTAALLLTPPRRWWMFLLAAFPVHLAVQLPLGWPPGLILTLFATNCIEAVVGAGIVHRFSDSPDRFDTLRRAALFVVAVVLAAVLVSGFMDAAAVAVWRGEPYWRVWRTRLLSNTVTALALVPVVVTLVGSPWRPLARRPSRRAVEAILLFLVLVFIGSAIFSRPFAGSGVSLAWSEQSSLVLLLPVLLWAATRFGAAGSSFAMLTTALLAFAAATTGQGSPTAFEATRQVRGLQAFLLVAGIPLFALGALMDERRSREAVLEARLRFESLLSRVSGAFVHLPSNAMDSAFEAQLREVGESSGLASVVLFRLSPGDQRLHLVSSWSAPGPGRAPGESGAWSLTVPLEAGGRLLGTLVFGAAATEPEPLEEAGVRLRLLAEVFASALARKESEDALRAGEEMKSAILASLSGEVAVLDREGRIIAANADGIDFLAEGEAAEGITSVLDGRLKSFNLEYQGPAKGGDRWFLLSVAPLRRVEGGAVAARVEVTQRHRAEDDARRSRDELAHFLRVSTVGELTTSLAHELNQPLAAILANAQAARRILGSGRDAGELPEILGDIIEEDKRAGEVIGRLRDLLRKGEPVKAPLDLSGLAADVVRLVGSDAILRDVSIGLDLSPKRATVIGDRVQIQQVLLNLLLNAMDAMADCPASRRQVMVSTSVTDAGIVQVAVSDLGKGLGDCGTDRIFEPFYTTKPSGMGMGLSIARSIVVSHGGRLWARNNPGSGATFVFALPLAPTWP
jgi:signal transduction histidine kinase